jgi:hypothetical protein
MLEFTCKSCGKRVQGDEALAGQRVLCPACRSAMTFPQTASASALAKTPATGDARFCEKLPPLPEAPPSRGKVQHVARQWTPYLLVGTMALIILLLAIPELRRMREAALRTESTNHLKEIGLAFHSFHDANRRLPYNGTVQPYAFRKMRLGGPAIAGDRTTGSWAFMILPYLDQQVLFNTKDMTKGVAVFMCPGRGRPDVCMGDTPGAWTDYFLNSFINDPNGNPDAPDRRRKLAGITDGTTNTILLGHGQIIPSDYSATYAIPGYTDSIFNGGSAGMCRPNRAVSIGRDAEDSTAGDWGGPFEKVCLMCMCDGSVRAFPYSMSGGIITNGVSVPEGLGSFFTPSGGEAVCIGCD